MLHKRMMENRQMAPCTAQAALGWLQWLAPKVAISISCLV
jgi:hypothetical protein